MNSSDSNNSTGMRKCAVTDEVLRAIAEQGFFGSPGSLADARSACAELIFARTVIQAQTAKIQQLVRSA